MGPSGAVRSLRRLLDVTGAVLYRRGSNQERPPDTGCGGGAEQPAPHSRNVREDPATMNYFPNPGDPVNLTVRAVFDGNSYIITDDGGRAVFETAPGSSYEIVVEPAEPKLPTLPHAVIRAEAKDGRRLVLCRAADRKDYPWYHAESGCAFPDSGIVSAEVLFPGVTS